uniref:Capsid protein n=1 Tax=Opuntia virus 1 TaxID=2706523 RepID=A0A6C0MBV2_9GEMI|nr:capsid protein [Opuntia virus 1]QHU79620.1 capsid protein [Opuntia virus 1]QHU79626.1 capsid protein [Opuntia virus 1]QHU79632.1 capsid protein [Opuntia virus 1]
MQSGTPRKRYAGILSPSGGIRKSARRRLVFSTPTKKSGQGSLIPRLKRQPQLQTVHRQQVTVDCDGKCPHGSILCKILNDMSLGQDETQRHSNKVNFTYVSIRGELDLADVHQDLTAWYGQKQYIFMWLFLDRTVRGDTFDIGDFFKGSITDPEQWFVNANNRDRFILLKKRRIMFQLPCKQKDSAGVFNSISSHDRYKPFEFRQRLRFQSHWDNAGKLVRNRLLLLCSVGKAVEITMNSQMRLYFNSA